MINSYLNSRKDMSPFETGTVLFFLAGNRLGLAFAGAGIGMRTLSANRQAFAMTQATIAGEIHQTLDVHCVFATQVPFNRMIGINRFANMQNFRRSIFDDDDRLVIFHSSLS